MKYESLATPYLKEMMENPPPSVVTPAVTFLTSLQPPGIWTAPLSNDQISAAETFGQLKLSAGDNPYVSFSPNERVLIQLHTPFTRVARFFQTKAKAGKTAASDDVSDLNLTLSKIPSDLIDLDIISPHQKVSVIHILSDYSTENMGNTLQRKEGDNYLTTFTYPMPQGISPSLQLFEFYVPPRLFPRRQQYQVGFTLDFRVLH